MKIYLWSVGKAHEPYVAPGIEDFTRRISKYFPVEWKLIQAGRQGSSTERELKKHEALEILNALQKDDYLVLLDEKGKQLSSQALSAFIEQRANSSIKRLIFLIGGAYGVDDVILKKADCVWSLSLLVFPHQLVRLLLAEQLYRACTIIRNEKYHHS